MLNDTNKSNNVFQLQITRLIVCCNTKKCKQTFFWFDVCFACDHVDYIEIRFAFSVDLNSECFTCVFFLASKFFEMTISSDSNHCWSCKLVVNMLHFDDLRNRYNREFRIENSLIWKNHCHRDFRIEFADLKNHCDRDFRIECFFRFLISLR